MSNELNPSFSPTPQRRRHDMDALRGVAMLLGIVLHGAISFIPGAGGWAVKDPVSSEGFAWLLAGIHGFRMPLFFLISGYFTMMLYRRRGMASLLRQRTKRILVPMLIGLITIIPANWIVSAYVGKQIQATQETQPTEAPTDIFASAASGDVEQVRKLIDEGADIDQRSADGATALLIASFFGRVEVVELLLARGADPNIANYNGDLPNTVLAAPWGITQWLADLSKVQVQRDEVEAGRRRIAGLLPKDPDGQVATKAGELRGLLFDFPLFGHLWFLWFLTWLVAGFAIVITVARWLRFKALPDWMTGRFCYLWLIPATMAAQSFMRNFGTGFGPDTSLGLLPIPSVLIYYALFFGFGAICFDREKRSEHGQLQIGNLWWVTIPACLLLVFPVGLILTHMENAEMRWGGLLAQSCFAWMMTFGMMGLFRKHLSHPSATMRYLSDSSYWLYLAHIPLIIYVQYWVYHYQLPAAIKFAIVCSVTTVILLLSYHWFVRYTPIGTLLNGKRSRTPESDRVLEAVLLER
ncbi:acyltransferase family protein [Rubripirellula amarantea]|nr:acyltransferase family protein [Rubripirellula amarantea]